VAVGTERDPRLNGGAVGGPVGWAVALAGSWWAVGRGVPSDGPLGWSLLHRGSAALLGRGRAVAGVGAADRAFAAFAPDLFPRSL